MITQDIFNKMVTSSMMIFTMIMIVWSFASGKSLDPNIFLSLIPVAVVHSSHLISNKFTDKNGSNGNGKHD